MDVASFIRENQDKDAMLRRSLDTLVNLYTDKTHFIYELLQNAEDAHATNVSFIQHNGYLEMMHDGLPFTQSNAQAICDAAYSDKTDGIGKFGVGFKAVFAICSTVELYSEPDNFPEHRKSRFPGFIALPRFAFEIQNYTDPVTIEGNWTIDAPYTTRFVFPYDHRDRFSSINELRLDVAKKLQNLGADVMLFLKNIDAISFKIIGVDGIEDCSGVYMLGRKDLGNGCTRITSLSDNGSDDEQDSEFIMYSKCIENTSKSVDIVFAIEESEGKPTFIEASDRHRSVYVYFPTETESKLKFIIQAPFATTPNRESVLNNDKNAKIVEIAAELLQTAVLDIKKRGWLTLEFLNLLPFTLPSREWLFKPLYDITIDMLSNEEILPTIDGGYTTAENANIARGESLTKLFKGEILCKLLNNENAVWLPTKLTETNRNLSGLFWFLTRELDISLWRADDLPELFTDNKRFLESMSDEWLERFYIYLSDEMESLLKSNDYARAPFVKMSDGSFYAPFTIRGRDRIPNVFVRPRNSLRELSGFKFIADFIVKNCIDFVKILGIDVPNDYDYFVQELKDIYEDETMDESLGIKQTKKALRFLTEGHEGINETLSKYLWLYCIKSDGEEIWTTCNNSSIYFKNDVNGVSLYDYFIGTDSGVYVLNEDFYTDKGISRYDLLRLRVIGVKQSVYENDYQQEWSYNPVCWNIGHFRLNLNFLYIDSVLKAISQNDGDDEKKRSKSIFMLLKNVCRHLKGQWAMNRKSPKCFDDTAKIVKILKDSMWVFSSTGARVNTGDISRYELDTSVYGIVDEESGIYDILGFAQNESDQNIQLFRQIISMDTNQITSVFRNLPQEIKKVLLLELADEVEKDSEEDVDEFDPEAVEEEERFPDEIIKDLQRLKDVTAKRYYNAPDVRYEPKLLRIRVSRGQDRENIGNRYKGYCQMCGKPNRFWEVVEIFNNPTKELEFMNLSLCPNCASKYRRLRNDRELMAEFANNLRSASFIDQSAIVGEDCITFTKVHLAEVKTVLDLDRSIPKL